MKQRLQFLIMANSTGMSKAVTRKNSLLFAVVLSHLMLLAQPAATMLAPTANAGASCLGLLRHSSPTMQASEELAVTSQTQLLPHLGYKRSSGLCRAWEQNCGSRKVAQLSLLVLRELHR